MHRHNVRIRSGGLCFRADNPSKSPFDKGDFIGAASFRCLRPRPCPRSTATLKRETCLRRSFSLHPPGILRKRPRAHPSAAIAAHSGTLRPHRLGPGNGNTKIACFFFSAKQKMPRCRTHPRRKNPALPRRGRPDMRPGCRRRFSSRSGICRPRRPAARRCRRTP